MKLTEFLGNFFRRKQYLPFDYALNYNRGWTNIVNEPYAGAWQKNDSLPVNSLFANSTVYRCISLIAADIAKMRIKLVREDANDIWQEIDSPAFSPLLRKPNEYQNRIQFFEHWLTSKLGSGNTYVLKARDNRNVVTSLYVLDPHRVKPLVSPPINGDGIGDVFYELRRDDLSGIGDDIKVPASEIIHDRMNALFHPLCGLSPIYAAALAATQAIRIQNYSDMFFSNWSRPHGILSAPGVINKETAERLKNEWKQNYGPGNAGSIAALGDGLKFEAITQDAVDSQLIEQLQWSAKTVCSVFGVPAYKVGVEAPPAYNNVEAINQEYYSQTLQTHIESIELLLDEGIGLTPDYGTEFDLDGLLRMDTATMVASLAAAVKDGIMAPNEARQKLGLSPVAGGNTPYLQQQNYSLSALNKRDHGADPFGTAPKPQPAPAPAPAPANDNPTQQAARAFRRELANVVV